MGGLSGAPLKAYRFADPEDAARPPPHLCSYNRLWWDKVLALTHSITPKPVPAWYKSTPDSLTKGSGTARRIKDELGARARKKGVRHGKRWSMQR